MGLRFASAETKRIELEDGDYLEVKTDISKQDFNNLMRKMPQDIDSEKGATIGQATQFGIALFDTFVVGWSMEDVPATLENYLKLKREDADAIDSKLGDHFASLTPSKEEQTKSKRGS